MPRSTRKKRKTRRTSAPKPQEPVPVQDDGMGEASVVQPQDVVINEENNRLPDYIFVEHAVTPPEVYRFYRMLAEKNEAVRKRIEKMNNPNRGFCQILTEMCGRKKTNDGSHLRKAKANDTDHVPNEDDNVPNEELVDPVHENLIENDALASSSGISSSIALQQESQSPVQIYSRDRSPIETEATDAKVDDILEGGDGDVLRSEMCDGNILKTEIDLLRKIKIDENSDVAPEEQLLYAAIDMISKAVFIIVAVFALKQVEKYKRPLDEDLNAEIDYHIYGAIESVTKTIVAKIVAKTVADMEMGGKDNDATNKASLEGEV